MNDSIGAVKDRKAIAPLVRFERKVEEDPKASLQQGRAVTRDVDYAIITPPYSKDEVFKEATAFLKEIPVKVAQGKLSASQGDHYQRQYASWKQGQEMPLVGTPIRGWPVLTPAQQENLIRLNIPTVEYLAEVNDEGCRQIGMGALEQKRKAVAWLAQATDKGPLTQQMASLQTENDLLKGSVAQLTQQVEAFIRESASPRAVDPPVKSGISAADLLDEPELTKRPGGRAKKEG